MASGRQISLVHGELGGKLVRAFFDVFDEHDYGFSEGVYLRSLPLALAAMGIASELEVPLRVSFRGCVVGEFRADLVVDRKILVETKAAPSIHAAHERQLLNYLAASPFSVGYLLNFGPEPRFRRFVMTYDRNERGKRQVKIDPPDVDRIIRR